MGDRPCSPLSDLVAHCGNEIEEEDILAGLAVWIRKGVVRECSSRNINGKDEEDRYFEIVEDQASLALLAQEMAAVDDDNDAGHVENMSMNAAAEANNLKSSHIAIDGFVKGLLTSHGSMSLERIHSMLKLLLQNSTGSNSEACFGMNLVGLRLYLQSRLEQLGLEVVDGHYSKKRELL